MKSSARAFNSAFSSGAPSASRSLAGAGCRLERFAATLLLGFFFRGLSTTAAISSAVAVPTGSGADDNDSGVGPCQPSSEQVDFSDDSATFRVSDIDASSASTLRGSTRAGSGTGCSDADPLISRCPSSSRIVLL
ncbi:hypothetical protein PR202_gb03346 [Eleusine coracana subsp. coracana]|uniref:Secreted protein n=1 Tax=Eleusine coracana subsp. coracana TaxID=191504 RepID=A0AAV5DZ89_ELECO|nr:hypothetical protein PR202_gb03346 [Eleusine coracana subsp. coracana]